MYLKKIQIGNPLHNLKMQTELDRYEEIQTDEELASLYHELLDKAEEQNNEVLENFTYAMIAYSTSFDFNPLILL